MKDFQLFKKKKMKYNNILFKEVYKYSTAILKNLKSKKKFDEHFSENISTN